jgi:UDP-N-acetylglucosamine--N-acetylmuramyl-(pentapeptide) pyrophosphoryl-undecaprenol N-acetylglucosamine transferase
LKRVCLVSSGTGGHLVPALALAARLREHGHETVLLTEGRGVESAMLERAGVDAVPLHVGGPGLALPWRLLRAAGEARSILKRRAIDLVLATGGKTSVPVALAARSLSLPVCLLEQNATTGRCNRLLAPLARRIYLGLPQRRPLRLAVMTGTPLRAGIGRVSRAEARHELSLAAGMPTILVMGGSQGARALNETVPKALVGLGAPLQVLHLAGPGHEEAVRVRYGEGACHGLVAHVRPLVRDVGTWYAAADLVICRGGGCTIAELMAAGRPAIVVPYPHHKDRQQFWNGKVLEAAGGGVVVEQHDLHVATLQPLVRALIEAPDRLAEMGEKAHAKSPRDPCAAILEDLHSLAYLN